MAELAAEGVADAWAWKTGILEAVTESPFFSVLILKSTQIRTCLQGVLCWEEKQRSLRSKTENLSLKLTQNLNYADEFSAL